MQGDGSERRAFLFHFGIFAFMAKQEKNPKPESGMMVTVEGNLLSFEKHTVTIQGANIEVELKYEVRK